MKRYNQTRRDFLKRLGIGVLALSAPGVGFGEKVLIAEDEISIAKMHDGKEDIPIRFCIVAKVEDINQI